MSGKHPEQVTHGLATIEATLNQIILGKPGPLRLALSCLLAGGHLLLEDQPGVGKTTLATALSNVFGLAMKRIQFTSDLLPADIIGSSIFDREHGEFVFKPGPLFTQLVLADEINRATPRTQSALLEAMEERRVSVDGHSHVLEPPFFVIATQNPGAHVGTYRLPESQLDRFLMRLSLGYPDAQSEQQLLAGADPRDQALALAPVVSAEALLAYMAAARAVHVAEPVITYVVALLGFSREEPRFAGGLSPRAGRGLIAASRAFALLEGRDHVLPDDVSAVLAACVDHRLEPADETLREPPSAILKAGVEPL